MRSSCVRVTMPCAPVLETALRQAVLDFAFDT
jgi:hypothetical protein